MLTAGRHGPLVGPTSHCGCVGRARRGEIFPRNGKSEFKTLSRAAHEMFPKIQSTNPLK